MTARSFILSTIISGFLLIPSVSIAEKLKVYRVPTSKPAKLIIYSRPTIHSHKVKKLPANTRWIVRLAGIKRYSHKNTWLEVSSNGKRGWMPSSLLIFDAKATLIAAKNPKCLRKKTRKKVCEGSI